MATYDREKLIEGLNNLTGFDFTKAELRVRRDGDMTPDVTFSKRFQAEVAAIALKESSKVLMTMPISEFTEMCAEVSVFYCVVRQRKWDFSRTTMPKNCHPPQRMWRHKLLDVYPNC